MSAVSERQVYKVSSLNGRTLHIEATSGSQAKRLFCKEYGIKPSDSWCGVTSLSAKRLSPSEVTAWKEQTKERQAINVFIKGMLDIYAMDFESRKEQSK